MGKDTGLATILITAARTRAMGVARELQSSRERLDGAAAVAAAANNDVAEATKAYSAARQAALAIGVWTDQELVDAGARRVLRGAAS